MKFFHFEEPENIKGVTMYRIVNDVSRAMPGTGQTTRKGSHGGLVERPELLDPETDLWFYSTVRIYGETTVEGSCCIRNATIRDCSIRGNVVIGNAGAGTLQKKHETVIHMDNRVFLRSCRLDSGKKDDLSNRKNHSGSMIQILDRSYILNSEILGTATCKGSPHILGSCIDESRIRGKAFIANSTLLDGCLISGSVSVDRTTAWGSCVLDEATASRCQLWYRTLRGNSSMIGDVYTDGTEDAG